MPTHLSLRPKLFFCVQSTAGFGRFCSCLSTEDSLFVETLFSLLWSHTSLATALATAFHKQITLILRPGLSWAPTGLPRPKPFALTPWAPTVEALDHRNRPPLRAAVIHVRGGRGERAKPCDDGKERASELACRSSGLAGLDLCGQWIYGSLSLCRPLGRTSDQLTSVLKCVFLGQTREPEG